MNSKELADRVPKEGEEGVVSPIKLEWQRQPGKVLLSLRVEPEMVLLPGQGVDLEVPNASQDSSKPLQWCARATSVETAKKQWGDIFKKAKAGKEAEDMAEKYKQYRVGNTRMIRPPLNKGKTVCH